MIGSAAKKGTRSRFAVMVDDILSPGPQDMYDNGALDAAFDMRLDTVML